MGVEAPARNGCRARTRMVAEARPRWPADRARMPPHLAAVIAILGGLGTAVCWAMSLLGSSRSARLIGAVVDARLGDAHRLRRHLPAVVLRGLPVELGRPRSSLLAVVRHRELVGCSSSTRRSGAARSRVVGPIVSTEGAIGAVIAVVAGERRHRGAGAASSRSIASASSSRRRSARPPTGRSTRPARCRPGRDRALLLPSAARVLLRDQPLRDEPDRRRRCRWPGRSCRPGSPGVVGVAHPAARCSRRLRLTRAAAPFVLVTGLAEVARHRDVRVRGPRGDRDRGGHLLAVRARSPRSRRSSCFGERLTRVQVIGVVTIASASRVLGCLTRLSSDQPSASARARWRRWTSGSAISMERRAPRCPRGRTARRGLVALVEASDPAAQLLERPGGRGRSASATAARPSPR